MSSKMDNGMSEEKRNIIRQFIELYGIKTAADAQEALKDLLSGTIQSLLEAGSDPRAQLLPEQNSAIEPPAPNSGKNISEIEGKILAMYFRGMDVAQISEQIHATYGVKVTPGILAAITNKLLPEIEAWRQRPLSGVYPIVYIDRVNFAIRESDALQRAVAHVVLGLSETGYREILSVAIGENEGANFCPGALHELKSRGVQNIFVICADELSGLRDAIAAVYPGAEYQRCVVHMVRSTLKYAAEKDKKAFATALKAIYHAPDEQSALLRLEEVQNSWEARYPGCMRRWSEDWDSIRPMFKFSQNTRNIMCNTNAIESLNSGFHRLNQGRADFPNALGMLKALYVAGWELKKKRILPMRSWRQVYAELDALYPGRMSRNKPVGWGQGSDGSPLLNADPDKTPGKCPGADGDGDQGAQRSAEHPS